MKHLDLFSGIGGFAYAADQVFGNVTHTFCDNDKFCQAVLRKHWPESEIFDDIKQITADTYCAGLERASAAQPPRQSGPSKRLGLLTGGFPCQPFSAAGLRRGTADDRHLWPEMLRVIRATAPEWVIAENVGGIVSWNDGLVFEQVCTDLEAANYEVQPFIIPAAAINAPHRRDRVWFVAHTTDRGSQTEMGLERQSQSATAEYRGGSSHAADAERQPGRGKAVAAEASVGGQGSAKAQQYHAPDWGRSWSEVAAELCGVDDGLPVKLDGYKLTRAKHREHQIHAYGNAIVPQVAMAIMEAMKA